jgi:hypothetical protein
MPPCRQGRSLLGVAASAPTRSDACSLSRTGCTKYDGTLLVTSRELALTVAPGSAYKSEGRSVSEAPFIFDGGKPNSVRPPRRTGRSFIFQPQFFWRAYPRSTCFRKTGAGRTSTFVSAACDDTRRLAPKFSGHWRTGCPPPVLSCTAWGFSCRANYSARGELLPRLFTLACAFLKEPAVSFL